MEVPEWEDPRRVLARHGLSPKRGFSQNFLVSRVVIERIVAALQPRAGERVVELGPGLGTLTAGLLRAGARVLAIDADRDMLRVLAQELGGLPALEARLGDAAALELAPLGGGQRLAIAGNLPYALTGAIFRRLIIQHALVDRAVLMVQREVRDRLLAAPGSKQYGALSVFARAVFEVEGVCLVPAGAFHPPPRVDSAVLRLTPRATPVDPEQPDFQRCVRASFDARRKTLRNALLRAFPAEQVERGLSGAAIDGKRRGETLSVQEFDALARALG